MCVSVCACVRVYVFEPSLPPMAARLRSGETLSALSGTGHENDITLLCAGLWNPQLTLQNCALNSFRCTPHRRNKRKKQKQKKAKSTPELNGGGFDWTSGDFDKVGLTGRI